MIEARNLTKRYGPTVAVDALSFDVRPGREHLVFPSIPGTTTSGAGR